MFEQISQNKNTIARKFSFDQAIVYPIEKKLLLKNQETNINNRKST